MWSAYSIQFVFNFLFTSSSCKFGGYFEYARLHQRWTANHLQRSRLNSSTHSVSFSTRTRFFLIHHRSLLSAFLCLLKSWFLLCIHHRSQFLYRIGWEFHSHQTSWISRSKSKPNNLLCSWDWRLWLYESIYSLIRSEETRSAATNIKLRGLPSLKLPHPLLHQITFNIINFFSLVPCKLNQDLYSHWVWIRFLSFDLT